MPLILKEFQRAICDNIVDRFLDVQSKYKKAGRGNIQAIEKLRKNSASIILQAPTGIGKTLIAAETVGRFSDNDKIVWFWFAPFTAVVEQTRISLSDQAPQLHQLDLMSDRRIDAVIPGSVFITTTQSFATRKAENRIVRQSGDLGLSLDDLVVKARDSGYRIGCVVDEAHHGFVKATEAVTFFTDVLKPDYALLMTATPNDRSIQEFGKKTGYYLGTPEEWASISRADGVAAGLLKKGVKMARFIAKREDEKALISFEQTALAQCAITHRYIKQVLTEQGISITPLMLVQVPNGRLAQAEARKYLIDALRFSEDSVVSYTADKKEPDADLIALANDPNVEVILFKMAIALGFDAPRAWTMAALRGARDPDFGVQVVGRLMRVHKKLQGVDDPPGALQYGYVYLANDEAQEGLMRAGDLINQVKTQASVLGSQTVVTCIAGTPTVQLVKAGDNLKLFSELIDLSDRQVSDLVDPNCRTTVQMAMPFAVTFEEPHEADSADPASHQNGGQTARTLVVDASTAYHYRRKEGAPGAFITEYLPEIKNDFEDELLSQIDFTKVLIDRERTRASLRSITTDVFEEASIEDSDIWATLDPVAVARKARQLVFQFEDVDARRFIRGLVKRFQGTLLAQGIAPPDDEEILYQQLDLVLVRNPKILTTAYRKCRVQKVKTAEVFLPAELIFDDPQKTATKNIYGIFPQDLNSDERPVAEMLDADDHVIWWHRNPVRKDHSVALYGWADGQGFFPDFIVGVDGRTIGGGIALLEVKGPHLQGYEKNKAAAVHAVYSRVCMVGRESRGKPFEIYRLHDGDLMPDGSFEPLRLRW